MRHARASFALAGQFGRVPAYGPDSWHFAHAPELHLGPDALVPDPAGWRRERMPTYPDTAAFTLAPDWICEILSPNTRRFDLTEKRDLYRHHTVAFQDGKDISAAPFEAVSFPLSALWPD